MAQREHSRAELQRKLLAHLGRQARLAVRSGVAAAEGDQGPEAEEATDLAVSEAARAEHVAQVAQLLDELSTAGWLNEQRAAEQLVQTKAARYGQRRLRQLLSQRAIDQDAAAASLAAVRESELDRARELWRRRFGSPAADVRERARQQRFLAARGFESGVINRVLKEAAHGHQGEPLNEQALRADLDD